MIAWKGKRPVGRWTLKSATSLPLIELMKMDTRERAELAQFLHNQFQLRVNSFVRAGTVSYALNKIYQDVEKVNEKLGFSLDLDANVVTSKRGMRVLSTEFAERKNPQNALASYISLLQGFFSWKSSTVKGWREIGEKEDKRIFGVNTVRAYRYEIGADGKRHRIYYDKEVGPKYQMTDAERIQFWRVYEDLYKTGWTNLTYSSESQREFGSLWMKGKLSVSSFEDAYSHMEAMLSAVPDKIEEHAPNVQGDFFQRKGGRDSFDGYKF